MRALRVLIRIALVGQLLAWSACHRPLKVPDPIE